LEEGRKRATRIDARKLVELLRNGSLSAIYPHAEGIVSQLLDLQQSLGRVMIRLKALYRSWAILCAGTQAYPEFVIFVIEDRENVRTATSRSGLPGTNIYRPSLVWFLGTSGEFCWFSRLLAAPEGIPGVQ
jgi:hypothetical protein